MIASSAKIHASALVEDGASIGENTIIGPFCAIGPKVKIGANVDLKSHVVVMGNTDLGEGAVVFPHAVLGGYPQNIHYKNEDTLLIIGKNCTIREGVTMNVGMPDAGNKTVIGNNCLFLAYAHVAHDCLIGDHVILSNNVMLGGHVEVGNNVIMGGGAAIHQFVRIGHHAFIGGVCVPNHDVIPFAMANGVPGSLMGLNVVGLKRAGYQKSDILNIRRFLKNVFEGRGTFKERLALINRSSLSEVEKDVYDFICVDSKRGLLFPANTSQKN